MKKYCDLIPRIHDKQGNEVESKLFSNLLSFYKNDRKATKKAYFAAIHPVFLDSIANNEDVTFDENGEITLHSLIKVANLDPQNDVLIEKLNKDIKSGVYSYVEGLQKARDFNKSEYGDRFLATLTKDNGGKYRLSVVHKTPQSIVDFENTLVEKETLTMIMDELENQGVRVDFTDTKEYDGRFSTASAVQAADGMYHLIEISRGAKNMDQALIEEAAHFAIAALRGTTPVQRLLNMCSNPEIAERLKLYSEEEKELGIHENVFETAGRILSLSFSNKNLYGFGGFINRVKSFIFDIISKISPKSFIAKRQQLMQYAQQVADEFSFGNASMETALDNEITLFSDRHSSVSTKTLISIRATIKKLANKLYVADVKLYNLLKDSEAYTKLAIEDVSQASLSRAAQLSQLMMTTVLQQLEGYINNIHQLKSSKDTMSTDQYNKEFREQVYMITQYTNSLIAMRDSLTLLSEELLKDGNTDLKDYLHSCSIQGASDIDAIIGVCGQLVKEHLAGCATEIFTGIVGSDSVVMKGKINKMTVKNSKGKEVTVRELVDTEVTARDLVTRVFNGRGAFVAFIGRLFQAPHKLNDTALSYLKMYIRDNNIRIQRHISSVFEPEMNELERIVGDAGFKNKHDLVECLEKDPDGVYRNFRSEYKYSVYEKLRAEIIKEITKECKEYIENNPDEFPTKGSRTRFINKSIRESSKLASFEDESWVIEANGSRHLNPDYEDGIYIDNDYIQMKAKAEQNPDSVEAKKIKAIEKLRQYKELVDSILNKPGGDMYGIPHRIPQISTNGTLIGPISRRSKRALLDTNADFEIGIEGTGIYQDALEQVESVFQKIPLYGIKKIDNPSTDLLTSLKLYTIMAVRYNELNNSLIDLQITQEALQRRTPDEGSKELKSQSDVEVEKAINKLLFGDSAPYTKNGMQKIIGGVTNTYFICATLLGNALSFVKNLIASNYTMMANSTVSEYYDLKNYILTALPRLIFRPFVRLGKKVINLFGAHLRDKDKLILQHINGTYNKSIAWDAYKPKAWLKYLFYQVPMELYSKGDEFSQEFAYLASLKHFKGYEYSEAEGLDSEVHHNSLNGIQAIANKKLKRRALRNIYKFSDKDAYGNYHEGTYLSKSFLKRKEDAATYAVLKAFLFKLDDVIDNNNILEESGDPFAVFTELSDLFYTKNTFTTNVEEVLEELNIEYQDTMSGLYTMTLAQMRDAVKKAIDNLVWTEGDLVNLSNGLISELVEVQGTYFTGLRAAIQTESEMQGAAIFFGYGIGAANKFFNSNFNVLTGKWEPSMMEAVMYSWLKTFKGVVQDEGPEGLELRRKSLIEFMTIAALNVPGLELLTRNKMAKEVLMKTGYNEFMIKRMHTLGNGYLWWFLFRFIANLFKNRNSDKIVDNLNQDLYKNETYKGYDLDKFELDIFRYSSMKRLMMGMDARKHLVFDLICPPPEDTDIISKNSEKFLESTFGKYNTLKLAIVDDPQFKDDAIMTIKKYSDFLHDYATLLDENPDTDTVELMYQVAGKYDIPKSTVDEILIVDAPYSMKQNKHGIHVKEGGEKSIIPYETFIATYGLSDDSNSLSAYNELVSRKSNLIMERYTLTDPDHVHIIADKILSNAYKNIAYDKESTEYKIAGIVYYLLACSADEVGSMMSASKNLKDIAANTKFVGSSYSKILTDVGGILKNLIDDKDYNEEALESMIRKSLNDIWLSKIGLESDDYGYVRGSKNPEELTTGELKYRTGAEIKDHFVKYSTKKNFESVKGQ